MNDPVVAKRYADAFMRFVKRGIGPETAIRDLNSLKNVVINDNPEFLAVLKDPDVAHHQKYSFIDTVLSDGFSEEVRDFLKLLVDKGRIDRLVDIIECIRLHYAHAGEVEALLKTSFPLDLELVKALEEKLRTKYGKKFKFYIDLDGDLLGGVQVSFENKVIDGTLRRRLVELKEKLLLLKV